MPFKRLECGEVAACCGAKSVSYFGYGPVRGNEHLNCLQNRRHAQVLEDLEHIGSGGLDREIGVGGWVMAILNTDQKRVFHEHMVAAGFTESASTRNWNSQSTLHLYLWASPSRPEHDEEEEED
jgi:hypothetical protein